MIIYTGGTGDPIKVEMLNKYDMGIMISSTPNAMPPKGYGKHRCALDNGAFACYRKGYPFQEDVFLKTMSVAYKNGIVLDFIVCPDIMCGGNKSLAFSQEWAKRLVGTPNLALAVQDGMSPSICGYEGLKQFSYIFIGGSVEWKWKHAKEWVDSAHKYGKKCHIGQVGTLDRLRKARDMGADSVDSTSFVRNGSWHIIDEFYEQDDLFKDIKGE